MADKTAPDEKDLQGAKLKHVEPKTGGGPDPESIKAMEELYKKHNGDKKKLAGELKVEFKDKAEFKDATDFAKQVLQGLCIKD